MEGLPSNLSSNYTGCDDEVLPQMRRDNVLSLSCNFVGLPCVILNVTSV